MAENIEQLSVENWRRSVEDRAEWRGIVKEAQSQVGLYGKVSKYSLDTEYLLTEGQTYKYWLNI